MDLHMTKITFVAPYEELKQLAEETANEYGEKLMDFKAIKVIGFKTAKNKKIDTDAIIARGVTAVALQDSTNGIPIIHLTVTGYDVIKAVNECRKKFNPKSIAIIGSANMIYGSHNLKEIFQEEIKCYNVEKEEEAEYSIKKALDEGADAIIGGVMTYVIALRQNINCVLIKSGKEAIRQSIDEAVRTALVAKMEREKAEQVKTIMDYAHEGIIAVDKNGIITVLNKAAEEIINVSAIDSIGKPIKDVISGTGLLEVLKSGREELGELQNLKGTMVASNIVPIKIKDNIVGAVANFKNVIELQELEGQIRKKIHSKGLNAKYKFNDIIGNSSEIKEMIEMCRHFSSVDSNILVVGETGTGKELIAQSIHNASLRRNGPFVAVNCAALPENLLESELFGYVEGAFTGALKGGKIGLFELAHQGTIFLDEISEISLALQGRLLRVLQEREIMRIGDHKVIPIDVRIISATNKNLVDMVGKGIFRQDLLYRIDVLKVEVLPLRRRGEDVMVLAEHFIENYNHKFNKNIEEITPEAKKLLLDYQWPGNIRELRNVCERLAVITMKSIINVEDIRKIIGGYEDNKIQSINKKENEITIRETRSGVDLQDIQNETIKMTLLKANGNKAEAARLLGISRTTLWRKLRNL